MNVQLIFGRGASVLAAAAMFAAVPAMAAVTTFSNGEFIRIPTSGQAVPYPSIVAVAGLAGPVTKVTATIHGFSHTFPDDVGALLVGPTGANVVLFNGAGGSEDAVNLTWVFDDAAAGLLPNTGILSSGTFQPSNFFPSDSFPANPPAPYGSLMSVFNGLNPNGNWSLFVFDFIGGDAGEIGRGWSLSFTTPGDEPPVIPEPATWALMIAGFGMVGFAARRRRVALAPTR